MKRLLLLPALFETFASFAQTTDCRALAKENERLSTEIAAIRSGQANQTRGASLDTSNGAVAVTDGDAAVKVRFVSCTASKSSRTATLTFLVDNTTGPITLAIQTNQNTPQGAGARAVDGQGGCL